VLLATYFFAFEIYCDFSGYSDIARGVSRVYGIELMKNFDAPYFSRSISEFWSRWHISLSTWFRDYVYIPLGGNRVSLPRNLFNLMTVFILSGFWHGANWTFVIWGALHGSYLICGRLIGRTRETTVPTDNKIWVLKRVWDIGVTFNLVVLAWVFFRAPNLSVAVAIIRKLLVPRGPLLSDPIIAQCVLGIGAVVAMDLFAAAGNYWENAARYSVRFRSAQALVLLFGVVLFGVEKGAQFIYFQF
jgi:D-alanyl-lipoteichoic acid acyltransferase DltB (MBOAT superfamily)